MWVELITYRLRSLSFPKQTNGVKFKGLNWRPAEFPVIHQHWLARLRGSSGREEKALGGLWRAVAGRHEKDQHLPLAFAHIWRGGSSGKLKEWRV